MTRQCHILGIRLDLKKEERMAFDYKKEFKEFYLPETKPQIVHVPKMQFVAVRGKGNPNEEDGEYKNALSVLYGGRKKMA